MHTKLEFRSFIDEAPDVASIPSGSNDPDTAASRLVSLTVPSQLDLRKGQVNATFAASVQDPDGVRDVIVFFDRQLATSTGAHAFQMIHGWDGDWSDGQHSYVSEILPANVGGVLNITHVRVEDKLGNYTTVSASALKGMGIDTSINIQSAGPDLTAPELKGLTLPKNLDLRAGNAPAVFAVAAYDQTEVRQVNIWFDRGLSYSFGTGTGATFYSFSHAGLNGFSGDDWSDGKSTSQLLFSRLNNAGVVNIDRIELTDVYGNERVYSNAELRGLGLDTSFSLISNVKGQPGTYVANLPSAISIREGQELDLALRFVGMTNQFVSYEYSTSIKGGTASSLDIGESAGAGSLYVGSTSATNQTEYLPVAALRDGTIEGTETAFLTVRLSGDMSFADGGNMKVIQINILDDNLTMGGDGNDTLHGTSAVDTLRGGMGNDKYFITPGDQVVELANQGIDTVVTSSSYALGSNVENLMLLGSSGINGTGNSLNNDLAGNAGANRLDGGSGADRMTGSSGNDTYLVDNIGDRTIEASKGGDDTVRAAVSFGLSANVENLVITGTGNLKGIGNTLDNLLTGNSGKNHLSGLRGNDALSGGSGNDVLVGGAGNDRLLGGGGADRLEGGLGKDWLAGGVGADRFVFATKLDSGATAKTRDVISDFKRGQGDHIDLKPLDANSKTAGNQAFKFIGDDEFSGTAGQLRFDHIKKATLVSADLNGDAKADFTLELAGHINLTAQDFFL